MFFSPSALGFFDSSVSEDCREVSNEVHNSVMDLVAQGKILSADENGNPITLDPPPPPELTPGEKIAAHIKKLNEEYEYAFAQVRSTYPLSEASTWPVQIKEALEYDKWRTEGRVGDAPLTPFLTDLTAKRDARGVGAGLEDLVDRVLANNSIFQPAITELTARRHEAEQAIWVHYQGGSLENALAVTWDFDLTLAAEPT